MKMIAIINNLFGFIVLPLSSAIITRLWFRITTDVILQVSTPDYRNASIAVTRVWLMMTILSTVNSAWFVGTMIWPGIFWFLKPMPVIYGILFGMVLMSVSVLSVPLLLFPSIRSKTRIATRDI